MFTHDPTEDNLQVACGMLEFSNIYPEFIKNITTGDETWSMLMPQKQRQLSQ